MFESRGAPETVATTVADFWAWFDREAETMPTECETASAEDSYLAIYGRAIAGAARRRPTPKQRLAIRDEQDDKCLYCDQSIGSLVLRRGHAVMLRPHYDHFIPFSFSSANRMANWVLACHVCNLIKHCMVFGTVAEAQRYVRARRQQLGYDLLSEDLQSRLQRITTE